MSLLGKIVAFLNILGAIAFFFLATMDYGRRQAWAYDVYRHDLLIHGLPLDESETDEGGRRQVDKLGAGTLADLFTPAGGAPVDTQVKEVQRVHDLLRAKCDAGADVVDQSALYAYTLLPLAETSSRREQLLNAVQLRAHYKQAYDLAAEQSTKPRMGEPRRPFDRAFKDAITALRGRPDDPLAAPFLAAMQPLFNKPFDAAFKEAVAAQKAALDKDRDNRQAEFEQAFNTALASKRVEKRPGGSAEVPIDPGERRKAIAHLLFNLTDVLAEDDVKREGSAAPGNKPLAGLAEGSPDYRDKVLDTEAYKRAYNRF